MSRVADVVRTGEAPFVHHVGRKSTGAPRRYDDVEEKRPVTYLCFPRYGHEVTCRRHVPSALAAGGFEAR